jgi:hypothetical protein
MKRLVSLISVAFFFVVFTPFASFAQNTSCKATISSLPEAPELKRLRLGMTMEQVKAQVPQITFGPTDEMGSSKTTINPKFDPRTEAGTFQDVRSVSLDFLDERLVSLWFGYDSNFKWKTVDEFVNGISTSLQLPKNWSTWKVRGKELSCSDFQLTVTLVAQSPSFRVLDRASEETLNARRIAKEEEAEAAAAAAAAEPETESDVEEIIGDSKSKTYYLPACQTGLEISAKTRVIFKTVAEAEKAGYKRAKGCSD